MREWRMNRGLSERDCADLLKISQGGLRDAEKYGGSLQLAYQLAGMDAGIKPFGVPDEETTS